MRGEFMYVWKETWAGIWQPLLEPFADDEPAVPDDIFCELFREFASALKVPLTAQSLADIVDNQGQSREAFERLGETDFANERLLAACFESTHEVLEDFGNDSLSNRYFNLLATFIDKFSLRYDLRRPCQLCPTLSGVFASLVRELRTRTASDAHLDALMKDFENAIRDLRADASEGRIKTCIQKQVNLLEALGRACPGVTGTALGAICDQVGTWPHEKLKTAMKNLYGFSCDYPGIRHGGTPTGSLRPIDMRDLVAVSVLLTGFTPYLGSNLNIAEVFGAGTGPVKVVPTIVSAPVVIGALGQTATPRRGIIPWLQDLLLGSSK